MPCRVRAAAEGAVRVSACGRGGGGECARGAYPTWQPVVGTGRWAPRGGCEALGTPPSERETHAQLTISCFDLFFLPP